MTFYVYCYHNTGDLVLQHFMKLEGGVVLINLNFCHSSVLWLEMYYSK